MDGTITNTNDSLQEKEKKKELLINNIRSIVRGLILIFIIAALFKYATVKDMNNLKDQLNSCIERENEIVLKAVTSCNARIEAMKNEDASLNALESYVNSIKNNS